MSNHIGPTIATTDKLKAIDCQACGYVHLDPLPMQDDLDKFYADEYYQEYNAGWFEKERLEQWYWRKVYRQRGKYAFELVWKNIISDLRQYACFLDVGAGCGWFVRAVGEESGIAILGQEPSEFARKYAAENLRIWLHDGAYLQFKNPTFDFIHMSFVLEHLFNPLYFLELIRPALYKNGILCLVVPNEFNPYQNELENYSPLHEHHLNYFAPHSLKNLCEKAGFEIVRHTSTFPIEWFALHGLNYTKHPRLGKIAHWLRMAIEWTGLTLVPERWERQRDRWAAQGVGREIELWLRKSQR